MNELLSRTEALVHMGETMKLMMTLLAMCTLRCYAAFYVAPPTNDQSIQGTVRNGTCVLIGLFIAWGQPLHLVSGLSTMDLLGLMLKEVLLGVVLGFAVAVVFWVAEGVGALIDNVAGYNSAQQTNPLSGEQSTPVSNLLSQLAISGFYMLGGMTVLVGLLIQSFEWWPMGSLAPNWTNILESFLLHETSSYMEMTVKIAAPALLVLVLVDIGFGLIGKTADKLEPSSLSQPVKGAVALLLLAMLVALFFEQARPLLSLRSLERELKLWVREAPPAAPTAPSIPGAEAPLPAPPAEGALPGVPVESPVPASAP